MPEPDIPSHPRYSADVERIKKELVEFQEKIVSYINDWIFSDAAEVISVPGMVQHI
jgi:hypothetical protein